MRVDGLNHHLALLLSPASVYPRETGIINRGPGRENNASRCLRFRSVSTHCRRGDFRFNLRFTIRKKRKRARSTLEQVTSYVTFQRRKMRKYNVQAGFSHVLAHAITRSLLSRGKWRDVSEISSPRLVSEIASERIGRKFHGRSFQLPSRLSLSLSLSLCLLIESGRK